MNIDSDGTLKILIARLTPEKTVSLSFSHKFIFDLIKTHFKDKVLLDYFFFPQRRQFAGLKNNGFNGAVSHNHRLALPQFDVIAVSNSFQLELINLFHLISMAKAPFKLKDRLNDETAPLIIAGGVNTPSIACMCGSIDYETGPFDDGSSSLIDLVFMGEAECNLIKFIQTLLDNSRWKTSKPAVIGRAAAEIDGLYYPPGFIHEFETSDPAAGRYLKNITAAALPGADLKPARAAYIQNLDEAHIFNGVIYGDSLNTATVPVEISRGCASMCSFCKEGYTQKPYREKSAAKIIEDCRRLQLNTGVSRFNLYSYNFNDHSCVHDIVEGLAANSLEAEVKSQRVDMALKMPALISYLQASGSASPTFAIEGISARIRNYLSKNLTAAVINKFIDGVFINKPRQLKLFYIITGLETDEDFTEFTDFCSRLIKNRKIHSPSTAVVFSLMPLVQCQKTPLIFAPAPDFARVYEIIDKINKIMGGYDKITVRSSIGRKLYEISAILEYGGREITAALYDLAVNSGAAYYEEIDDKIYNGFIANIKKTGFSFSKFYAEKNAQSFLNSDDRQYGVNKKFLYNAWLNAKKFTDMPRCLRNSTLKCSGCGACGGLTAVYKNTDAAKRDGDFAAKIPGFTSRPKFKIIIPAEINDLSEAPHYEISKLINNAPFNIIDDSFSKLSFDRDKFCGKNYYLIESLSDFKLYINKRRAAFETAAGTGNVTGAEPPGESDYYKSLDFMLECNYIFAEVNIDRRAFAAERPDKSAAALFNRLNPKFKVKDFKADCALLHINEPAGAAAKMPPTLTLTSALTSASTAAGDPGFRCFVNADGLKKRPIMPLIITDNRRFKVYALFKADKQALDIINKARIIDYIKFYEYDVKNPLSACPRCGRVMCAPLAETKSAPPDMCFICAVTA
jgi:hypothetical protein